MWFRIHTEENTDGVEVLFASKRENTCTTTGRYSLKSAQRLERSWHKDLALSKLEVLKVQACESREHRMKLISGVNELINTGAPIEL